MRSSFVYIVLIFFVAGNFFTAGAKNIRNKHFKFRLEIPESMQAVIDSENKVDGNLYFDTDAGIVLLITKTEGKFHSVKDYIDCSRVQLENELQYCYDDPSLKVISCNKSPYYADKTVLLYLEVGVLPSGFDQSLIYFIHHKGKDIQFSFMFKKANARETLRIIDSIMRTLVLL